MCKASEENLSHGLNPLNKISTKFIMFSSPAWLILNEAFGKGNCQLSIPGALNNIPEDSKRFQGGRTLGAS
jgi:hypothetical protein